MRIPGVPRSGLALGILALAGLAALAGTPAPGALAEAGTMRMVVADLPYARVWDAATRALADYPLEQLADGLIRTGWRERAPGEGEAGFERLRERAVVRVEPFAERVTRVTVEVEAQGWRDGQWAPIADTEARARAILARIREAQG
jgi:hypothetical protein